MGTRVLLLSFLLAAVSARAACPTASPTERGVDAGLSFQALFPSRLPGLEISVPSYGIFVGVPVGSHALRLSGIHGSVSEHSVRIAELAFHLRLETPYLNAYASLGPHFLSYETPTARRNTVGGHAGIGFTLPVARNFLLDGFFKVYFQQGPMPAGGGDFRIIL